MTVAPDSLDDLLVPDPYKNCEDHCNHDLVRGVLTAELIGPEDGGYIIKRKPPPYPVVVNGRIELRYPE